LASGGRRARGGFYEGEERRCGCPPRSGIKKTARATELGLSVTSVSRLIRKSAIFQPKLGEFEAERLLKILEANGIYKRDGTKLRYGLPD